VSAVAVVCVAAFTTMLLEGNTAAFLFWFLLGIGSLAKPVEMAERAEAAEPAETQAGSRTGDPRGIATRSGG
jgi:hypothetical protein